jgi:hypothetical protein
MEEEVGMTSTGITARGLTDEDDIKSRCYCPLEKQVVGSPKVILDEAVVVFQEKLVEEGIPTVVNEAIEVIVSQCPKELSYFDTEMSFTFYALVEAVDEGITQFGPQFAKVYNRLTTSKCDPLYRRDLALSGGRLVSDVPTELNRPCVLITAVYSVSGECRGCVNGTSLFYDAEDVVDVESDGQQRNLLPVDSDSRRRLELNECVCLGGAQRPPTVEEISAIVESYVCDPDMTYAPTASPTCGIVPDGDEAQVLVFFFVDDPDGEFTAEDDAEKIASIVQSVVNTDMVNSFDPCDSEYIQISSINFIEDTDLPTERLRGRRLATVPMKFDVTCSCTGDDCLLFCREAVERTCEEILVGVETEGYTTPTNATSSGCIYQPRDFCFAEVSTDAQNFLFVGNVWNISDFENYTDVMPEYLVDQNELLENEAIAFYIQCTELPCSVAISNENADAIWFYGYDMFEGQLNQYCEQFDYLESQASLQDIVCMELEQEKTTLLIRETDGETTTGNFAVTAIDGSCRCFSGYQQPIALQEGGDDNWVSEPSRITFSTLSMFLVTYLLLTLRWCEGHG